MEFIFERTDAYTRAMEFADKALFLAEGLAERHGILADILRTSAVSIPLCLAEGYGKRPGEERMELFCKARRFCFKCLPLLTFLRRNGSLGRLGCAALRSEVRAISEMLSVLIAGEKKQ